MSRVHYGQSGYDGCSRSRRACEAEAGGRLPLSRAVREVAEEGGVSQRVAREALRETFGGEWHHTGRHARRTDYYSVQAALNWLAAREPLGRLPADWREQVDSAWQEPRAGGAGEERDRIVARLAAEAGVAAELVLNAYYGIWEE